MASASNTANAQPLSAGFCDNAKPIQWSRKMTDLQVRQIKEHNAVGHVLCGWKG